MSRAELKARAKAQLGNNIFGNTWLTALLACFIVGAITTAAGTILPGIGGIILTGPLSFGLFYIFLKQARDGQTMNIMDIFKGFTDDFAQTLLIGLMTAIFKALWSLLFVIPGIVKSYAYSMAFYIKADHPEYDWQQCINASKAITKGHKGELFILDLSFIGWYFVGALCLGIGTLWVVPYHNAAKAQFYETIK